MTTVSHDAKPAIRPALPRGPDDLKRVAPVAVVAFVTTWVLTDASDTLQFAGHDAAGIAFWVVASLAAALLAGVIVSPGRGLLVGEVTGLPRTVRAARAACGATVRFVGVGFAVAMLGAGLWLLPEVDAALAALLLVVLVTPARRLLAGLLLGIWRAIARKAELPGGAPALSAAVLVGLGAASAFLFGALIEATAARAIAAGVAAIAVVLRRSTPAATAVALAITVAAFTSLANPVAAGQDDTVEVPGDEAFVPTDIDVAAGQVVRIEASGTVQFLEDDDEAEAKADGSPAYYLGCGGPTFCGALVAKIGDDGGVQAIGETGSITADREGELHLGVNDFDFEDNEGSFSVTVTVTVEAPAAVEPGSPTTVTGVVPTGSPAVPLDAPDPLPSALFATIAAIVAGLGFPVGRSWGSLPPPWFAKEGEGSR